jgi:hypothetical protein
MDRRRKVRALVVLAVLFALPLVACLCFSERRIVVYLVSVAILAMAFVFAAEEFEYFRDLFDDTRCYIRMLLWDAGQRLANVWKMIFHSRREK